VAVGVRNSILRTWAPISSASCLCPWPGSGPFTQFPAMIAVLWSTRTVTSICGVPRSPGRLGGAPSSCWGESREQTAFRRAEQQNLRVIGTLPVVRRGVEGAPSWLGSSCLPWCIALHFPPALGGDPPSVSCARAGESHGASATRPGQQCCEVQKITLTEERNTTFASLRWNDSLTFSSWYS